VIAYNIVKIITFSIQKNSSIYIKKTITGSTLKNYNTKNYNRVPILQKFLHFVHSKIITFRTSVINIDPCYKIDNIQYFISCLDIYSLLYSAQSFMLVVQPPAPCPASTVCCSSSPAHCL
jgi:hypothetical protein